LLVALTNLEVLYPVFEKKLELWPFEQFKKWFTNANHIGTVYCAMQGRETLERAIKTIESRPEWGARVVYGDTDSVFVLLKGKTKVCTCFF
jgi:hypothetical protein